MSAAQDLFFLAHYAFNTLNPLVDEAKAIEPSTQFSIHTVLGHENAVHWKVGHIEVALHWKRAGMLALSSCLRNKTDVDLFAKQLRAKIDKLKLEAYETERRDETPAFGLVDI
jgi:hypothetical protein